MIEPILKKEMAEDNTARRGNEALKHST